MFFAMPESSLASLALTREMALPSEPVWSNAIEWMPDFI